MSEGERQLLRRLGEDSAYTFKGLHKQADLLDKRYRYCLYFPVIFSIVAIGFDEEIQPLLIKLIGVASLIGSVLALTGQKEFEKSSGYRELADKIKFLYDKTETAYHSDSAEVHNGLMQEWITLRKRLKDYPISEKAYRKTRDTIKKEMNLNWLGGEYC